NLMPPMPDSPASMPTRRKTSSNGAPKRNAIRLDMMPASTSTAPNRIVRLTVSIVSMRRFYCRDATDERNEKSLAMERNLAASHSGALLQARARNPEPHSVPARLDSGLTRLRACPGMTEARHRHGNYDNGGGTPSIIALAVSCSLITTSVAPCFFR